MSNEAINAELQKLAPSAIISLYVIDASAIDGDILRLYPGTDTMNTPVVWQGNTYEPMAMEVKGFDYSGTAQPPRPSLTISNGASAMSALCQEFEDLIGAKFIRKRTFAKFLDGMPDASPGSELLDDVFYFERKVSENRFAVEWELATLMVVDDLALPKRRVHSNLCGWEYRSTECEYTGVAVADTDDVAFVGPIVERGLWSAATVYFAKNSTFKLNAAGVKRAYYCFNDNGGAGISGANTGPPNATYWKTDQCSKRILGCKRRFKNQENTGVPKAAALPFGGFPGTQRLS